MKLLLQLKFILFIFIAFVFNSEAAIHEVHSVKEMLPHLDKKTLIVFDLDNTVFECAHSLGTDQWFCHYANQLQSKGLAPTHASEQALALWTEVQQMAQLRLVESETAYLIHSLQRNQYPVIALTTRGEQVAHVTKKWLKELGINMQATAPTTDPFTMQIDGKTVVYSDGILFTAAAHKGQVLWAFLEKADYHPDKIVFINDKLSHLLPVQETAEQNRTAFIGLRYGGADKRVKEFNPEIAEIQLEFYGKILSDEAAEAILQQRKTQAIK